MVDVDREARTLGRYLLGVEPDDRARALYALALEQRPMKVDPGDQRLCSIAIEQGWLLGPLDAALALRRPDSALRKKLFLMTAILETRPAYAAHFLARQTSTVGLARAALVVIRSALRAALGLALLPLVSLWT